MNTSQSISNSHIPQKEYDILYALSIITSIIFVGVSDAVKKCEMFHGPPLCIQKGGENIPVTSEQQGAINSTWLTTFTHLASTINDKLHNVFENVSINALDKIEHYALGDLGTKQFDKGILDQLQNRTMILGKMTRDPEVQKALKDMVEQLSILGIQMLDTMKPAIDRMTDKAIDTLNRTATKGTEGIMNTGMNTIASVISLIPIYGGVISLISAFLRGFNSAMLTAAPGIEFSTEAFFTAFNTSIKMLQDFLKVQPRLMQEANAVRAAIQNFTPSGKDISDFVSKGQVVGNAYAAKTLNSVKNPLKLKQSGGRANIQRKIQHITKRLKKTINRFTNNKRFTTKNRR
jgi:hypothetical protein